MQKLPFPDTVLWGITGCGKTTLGEALALRCGKRFFDTDRLLEDKHGIPVSEFIQLHGLHAFREQEHVVLSDLLNLQNCVISLGGGTLTAGDFLPELLQRFTCIWVQRDVDLILQSLSGQLHTRPLLKDNPHLLLKLLQERTPLYRHAHMTIRNNQDPASALDEILAKLSTQASR